MIRNLFLVLLIVGSISAEFPLHKPVIFQPSGRVYTAAEEAVKNNKSAISYSQRDMTEFTGITPKKVTLDGKKDATNPLFGAKIDHLVMLSRRPLVSVVNRLYLTDERTGKDPFNVFQSAEIKDAAGTEASSILALSSTAAQATITLTAEDGLAAIAAVPNSEGGFDGNGSGIAVGYFKSFTKTEIKNKKEVKTSFVAWDIIDASTGASSYEDGILTAQGNKAKPFGKDTPAVFIDKPVNGIATEIDLHFDRDLGRLYMALQVDAEVGARAVVMGSLVNGRLTFQKIAPDSAFSETDTIIGQKASGLIGIRKVRTMWTRTYVRYLIVVDNDNGVYALPLVDDDPENIMGNHGTLANVKVPPLALFGPPRFKWRGYFDPAKEPGELYTKDSVEAQVGGNGVLPGIITDIIVATEAVFVSTGKPADNPDKVTQGLFYSQPVFDEFGGISSWTDWQRVAADEPIKGFVYDIAGKHWYVPLKNDTQVKQTAWTNGTDVLDSFIAAHFSCNEGGVLGLFDFPFTTKGFSQQVGNRLAVQIFTGNKLVALVQSGADKDELFRPGYALDSAFRSTDGKLTKFDKATALVISGGALDDIGPISAATIIGNWFVIGGAEGIAVLADKQGQGWRCQGRQDQLGTAFKGLTSGHAWQIIRTTPNVRKLLVHNDQLFALTPRRVERMMLSPKDIAAGEVPATIVAQLNDSARSYSDLYIKDRTALLATSFGLFRSTKNISTVQDTRSWEQVLLPEAAGSGTIQPTTRFHAIKALQDNLYVLNAVVSLGQTQIYRLIVDNNNEVSLFPDFFLEGQKTFFLDIGSYRNYITTDGAFIAVSRSAFGNNPAFLQLLPPFIRATEPLPTGNPALLLPRTQVSKPVTMGPLVRNSASGAWMVTGDFGVRQCKGNK